MQTAWQQFSAAIKPPFDVPAVLLESLGAIATFTPGLGFYAYAPDDHEGSLKLRVTRSQAGVPVLGPNYAGLVQGAPLQPMPLELPRSAVAGVQLVPFTGGIDLTLGPDAVCRIALEPGQRLAPTVQEDLLDFGQRLWPVVRLLWNTESLRKTSSDMAVSNSAKTLSLELLLRVERVIDLVMRLGAEALGAAHGYLVNVPQEVLWEQGDAKLLLQRIPPSSLQAALATQPSAIWTQADLPQEFLSLGYSGLAALRLAAEGQGEQIAAYVCTEKLYATEHVDQVLQTLARSLNQALRERSLGYRLCRSYVDMLIEAARLYDEADPNNSDHSAQVAALSQALAQELGLPSDEVSDIFLAGQLHDVGMVALGLALPQTTGSITEQDRALLRRHPDIGADLLQGLPPESLHPRVEEAIRHHHERYDGLGYPSGLQGDQIPLVGRILAVSETFVARLSARTYREGLSAPRALFEITRSSGTQLDPRVVDALLAVYQRFGQRPQAPEVL